MIDRMRQIQRLYRLILNRDADSEGLNHYYKSNLSLIEIQHQLGRSDEFKTITKRLADECNVVENTPVGRHVPIYVINLKRRPDRRSIVETRLNNLGIERYTIVDGVDASDLTHDSIQTEYDDVRARQIRRHMPLSEIACALSHGMVARKIIDNNLPYAIVLEDDVQLTLKFKRFLQNFDTDGDYGFDFLMLGTLSSNHILSNKLKTAKAPHSIIEHNGVTYLDKVEYNIGEATIHSPHYPTQRVDYVHGAHSYVMSNRGARKYLELNHPVVVQADNVWNYFPDDCKIQFVNPLIAHTTYGDSDILFQRDKLEHDHSIFSQSFIDRNSHSDYGT